MTLIPSVTDPIPVPRAPSLDGRNEGDFAVFFAELAPDVARNPLEFTMGPAQADLVADPEDTAAFGEEPVSEALGGEGSDVSEVIDVTSEKLTTRAAIQTLVAHDLTLSSAPMPRVEAPADPADMSAPWFDTTSSAPVHQGVGRGAAFAQIPHAALQPSLQSGAFRGIDGRVAVDPRVSMGLQKGAQHALNTEIPASVEAEYLSSAPSGAGVLGNAPDLGRVLAAADVTDFDGHPKGDKAHAAFVTDRLTDVAQDINHPKPAGEIEGAAARDLALSKSIFAQRDSGLLAPFLSPAGQAPVLDPALMPPSDVTDIKPGLHARLSPGDGAALVAKIAHQIREGVEHTTELRLDPPELGRLRFIVSGGEHGLQLVIQADRSDTAELLRRHIELLGQDLRQAGYSRIDVSVGSGEQHGKRHIPHGHADQPQDMSVVVVEERSLSRADGGLDLRL